MKTSRTLAPTPTWRNFPVPGTSWQSCRPMPRKGRTESGAESHGENGRNQGFFIILMEFHHDCSNPLYVNYSHKIGKLVM